ncbi:ribbon-helix-helix protein, CopG family [Povalibacter sp.]
MNFNVYVDKDTAERLGRLAKARRTSRNRLARATCRAGISGLFADSLRY